jgi:hypothetical protein
LLRFGVAGLLRPAAGLRVRRVSRCPSHLLLEVGTNVPFPAPRFPTKSSPRQQPFRITAVVASLPFPSVLSVSPTRLPGSSKSVANKFVGALRLGGAACAVSPRAARLPRKKGGSGPPTTVIVGHPRGRAMTGATVADNRGRRNPRGYLPHRPKPVQNFHPPKPVEALPRDRLAVHRSGRSVDRVAGASCPPTSVGACRSAHRVAGYESLGPPKRVGGFGEASVPAEAGPCVPHGLPVPAEAGPCHPGGDSTPAEADIGEPARQCSEQPKPSRTSGPFPLGLPKQVFARTAAAGEDGVNHRPTSQAEAGSLLHRSEEGAKGPCPGSR